MNMNSPWGEKGYFLTPFKLTHEIKQFVRQEKWLELDNAFKILTAKDGELYQFLKKYHDFNSIEFIISIRDAQNDWEEDGIWHDDGSRLFAFSLSLTLDEIEGGKLGIRQKNSDSRDLIETPPFGTMIVFLTGQYGYEHKIHRVTKGRRVIIAGWCS